MINKYDIVFKAIVRHDQGIPDIRENNFKWLAGNNCGLGKRLFVTFIAETHITGVSGI